MSLLKSILPCSRSEFKVLINGFKTSSSASIDQRWRFQQGLTENPNVFGPLTNLPDYSYKDGSIAPMGVNQKKRLLKNRQYATKIIQLVGEIDFAVERYNRLIREKQEERQRILDSKLKPKGELLLEKKKIS